MCIWPQENIFKNSPKPLKNTQMFCSSHFLVCQQTSHALKTCFIRDRDKKKKSLWQFPYSLVRAHTDNHTHLISFLSLSLFHNPEMEYSWHPNMYCFYQISSHACMTYAVRLVDLDFGFFCSVRIWFVATSVQFAKPFSQRHRIANYQPRGRLWYWD